MQILDIPVQARSRHGKKATKATRREGLIPGVIYSAGDSKSFAVSPADVKHLVYTPDFKLAKIKLDDKEYTCILKDLQMHPVTDEIMHIDFQHMAEGRRLNVAIPVRFDGVSEGQKAGGSLIQLIRKVKIKVLPENMIDELRAEITEFTLGQSVRIKDLVIPEGVEVVNPDNTPIASIEVPRALRSVQDSEEEGEEGGVEEVATEAPAEGE